MLVVLMRLLQWLQHLEFFLMLIYRRQSGDLFLSSGLTGYIKCVKNRALTQVLCDVPPTCTRRIKLPAVHDEAGWYRFVHGRLPPSESERQAIAEGPTVHCDSESEVDDILEGQDALTAYGYSFREPTVAILRQLDTDDSLELTKLFRKWMQHAQFTRVAGEDPACAIHDVHARWLFALLAHIDRRLSSDEIATLRVLARACIRSIDRLRSARATSLYESDDCLVREGGAWMIVSIVVGVWAQLDLWDEAKAQIHGDTAVHGPSEDP